MPNYDQFKKAWNSMWNAERKKYTEQYKNDAQFQQFANQYSQEMKNTGTQWTVNQNLNTNTNQWTNTQQWVVNNQNQTNANETNWQNQTNFSEQKKPEADKSVVAENFDQSRLTNPNAEVSVKEWTAAQTWMPDYEADSDARDNEIVNNLNAYINSNPEFFSDRATFNQNFHYSERNQRQKALLDSFWKGQEDRKKASTYATGDSIVQGMNSWEITTDQMNYIKSMNPEAYREWQQKQEELVNKRIANYTVPADPVNTAELFNQLVEKLGLQQWDPYKIYENWYGMCEQLGVFALNSRLESKIAEIEQNANERTRALERITKEWAWRKSQQLINAEMAKTSAIYDSRNADLQTAYNALYNQRQQNLAIANQSATALQMQWVEDSRVFNNKLAWLGFAMQTAAFRTPEQNLQNQLNFQAASNELNLLNQSKINDLNLYNTYATNKLKNQMEAEATDLNTTDENQLRNNLNNVLSQYYSSYWDIIKRSQAQVVDDVIAYAKAHNCSIGEALTKNFIEPLQNKTEFKNLVASKYPSMNTSEQPKWTWKDNWDWTSSLTIQWVWDIPESINRQQRIKDYTEVADALWKNVQNTALALASGIKDYSPTGQCGAFVNDYLTALWISNWFGDYLDEKMKKKNQDYPTLWSVAIMDFWVKDKNWKPYWHVWIVTWINPDWSIVVTDSNWAWDEKKLTHTMSAQDMKYVKWYYNPTWDVTTTENTSSFTDTSFDWNGNTYDYTKYAGWDELTDDEKQTVENLLTYQTDPASLPKSWKDNWASNRRVRAAAAAIGRDYGYSERNFALVKNAEKKWDDAALPWGTSSANSTSMSILKAMSDSFAQWYNKFNINTVNSWINEFKKETWDPTVWQMYATSRVAASEIAKALKWWASATEQEVEDMKNLLDWNMWDKQARAVFQSFAKSLYEKNESEAKKFYETTWYKPNPIWTDDAIQWMTNLWIDLSKYYNYEAPIGWQTNSNTSTSYSLNFTSKYKK